MKILYCSFFIIIFLFISVAPQSLSRYGTQRYLTTANHLYPDYRTAVPQIWLWILGFFPRLSTLHFTESNFEIYFCQPFNNLFIKHGWASASRSMPPALVFWCPSSQSGAEAFKYWTGSPYSDIPVSDWVPALEFLFILVPVWPDVAQSGIPKNCEGR